MRSDDAQYTYRSADCRFGLSIPSSEMKVILRFCVQAGRKETGGILLGRYTQSHDMAVITEVAGPPADSLHRSSFFIRGIKGLQQLLNQLWRRKEYYLGEWHYHPFASASPSGTDEQQMREFASNRALNCPEPVLLIIGGDPNRDWNVKVAVYARNQKRIELSLVTPVT
ncbi:MAG: Mov34/MPN/PAD-1 family protein [Deltaproteobacteria bacterium]|nr:Mov34/MPN/PAD-1 family protein [Deltaproteobacteria bacterium]